MENIIKIAQNLLESKEINLIIGYQKGTGGKTRAAFFTSPESCSELVFDENCSRNIAAYLAKKDITKERKIAITANPSTLRSLLALASEQQLKEGNIFAITRDLSGDYKILKSFAEFSSFAETNQKPAIQDDLLKKIELMSPSQRWNFWQEQFSKCFKCYACRASCPLCYCDRCTVENNQPQWIPVPAHKTGNLEWHIMRAMHLAGRCINCNACSEACPQDIPLNILTLRLSEDIFREFSYTPGKSPDQTYALSDFNAKDKENFIK